MGDYNKDEHNSTEAAGHKSFDFVRLPDFWYMMLTGVLGLATSVLVTCIQ